MDCYALARRADGSIDQDALEACLEAQRGGMKAIKPTEDGDAGQRDHDGEGEGEGEGEGMSERCAWCIEP